MIQKFILVSLVAAILLTCAVVQASPIYPVKIIVVPDTVTPINESNHSVWSPFTRLLTLSKFLDFHHYSRSNYEIVLVIFTSGTYFVNSSKSQFYYTSTRYDKMKFTGEGHVVIKCTSEFNFKFSGIQTLYMHNIFFENCTGVRSEENSTLIVETDYPRGAEISMVNIQVFNPIGKGIIVNFRRGTSLDCTNLHLFSLRLINSSINTLSAGVYVKEKSGCIKQTFNISHVQFISSDSCIVFKGRSKTYTILNVTLSGSQCTSSVLYISPREKEYDNITHFTISHLNITNSRSQTIMHFINPDVVIQNLFWLHNNTGVALKAQHSKLHFCGAFVDISFNHVEAGSTVLVVDSSIVFKENCVIIFRNNSGQLSGGITAQSNSKIFSENVSMVFSGNEGEQGGAISLYSKSSLVIKSSSYLYFLRNQALKGGAIFIEKHQLAIQSSSDFKQCKIIFKDNTAVLDGNNIYGGWVDWSINDEDEIVYNPSFSDVVKEDSPGIASDPLRVCLCMNGVPDCNITEWNEPRHLYPGQILTGIEAVAVGQRYSTVVSPVVIRKESDEGHYEIRIVQRKCTNLTYNVSSQNNNETLLIEVLKSNEFALNSQNKNMRMQFGKHVLKKYPEKLGNLFTQLSIKLKLKDCPKAFTLDKRLSICACPQNLDLLGLRCDNSNYAIMRSAEQWVGMAYNQVIAHQFCPYDYCNKSDKSLSLHLDNDSEICAHNRRGILCGSCEMSFSKVLGTSKCIKCSNLYLLAIIPAFLLSGLLLIIFLMLFNLTVSSGTISGLIFYANVLQAQNATFSLPHASFPSVFIAWLNLDQGLQTCLYNGLDSYVESWLQFLFPAYIWLIAGVVIVSSHYSTRISKLCGKNAVSVLGTLFLLTYTKLLRLEITVVSYTSITYPNGHPDKTVWLYDGNVDYLKGKHIPLFIATVLLLVLLSVPYTLSLVSIQWLFKISHYRPMSWVHKLKPFFDAYTGPYRARHRYWTGLLLLTRILLLVSFSLNHSNNPSINILIIGVTSALLLIWLFLSGGVFQSKINNRLEIFFLCNLIITSFATQFERSNKIVSPVVIHVSTGIAFVVFMGIILYHAQKQLHLTKAGTKMKKLFKVIHFKWDSSVETNDNNLQSTSKDVSLKKVSCTVVELAEPLLADETRN